MKIPDNNIEKAKLLGNFAITISIAADETFCELPVFRTASVNLKNWIFFTSVLSAWIVYSQIGTGVEESDRENIKKIIVTLIKTPYSSDSLASDDTPEGRMSRQLTPWGSNAFEAFNDLTRHIESGKAGIAEIDNNVNSEKIIQVLQGDWVIQKLTNSENRISNMEASLLLGKSFNVAFANYWTPTWGNSQY